MRTLKSLLTRKNGLLHLQTLTPLISALENKVSAYHHKYVEALKITLLKKRGNIPQAIIRDFCKAFCKRLQQVIDADGRHIEKNYKYSERIIVKQHVYFGLICIF